MRTALILALALLLGFGSAQANIWYVDVAATGADDGTSWTDAFDTIQEGVNATADGDTVLVWAGTYNESIIISASDDLWIIGETGTPSDVIITPTGTTDSSDGNAIQYNAGDSLRVRDVKFQAGTGTALHQGIWHGSGKLLRVVNCEFEDMRVGIYNRNGNATTIEVYDSTFTADTSPEPNPTNGFTWAILGWDSTLTVQGCTIDHRGVTGESWNDAASIRNSPSATFRNNQFYGDTGDQQPFLRGDDANSNVLLEGNLFDGGHDTGGEAQVQLNLAINALDIQNDVVVRFNTFKNFSRGNATGSGKGFQVNCISSAVAGQLNRNIVIYGNKFFGDTTDIATGINLTGINGGAVFGNTLKDFPFTDSAGIQLGSVRHYAVHNNELLNCDNGIVIVANSTVSALHSYGVTVTGNYYRGDGDDGAFKIDNYAGAASPQDSMLTLAGNFYIDVAAAAKYVNTSDVTQTVTTAALMDLVWASVSTVDAGEAKGASDDPSKSYLAGVGRRYYIGRPGVGIR